GAEHRPGDGWHPPVMGEHVHELGDRGGGGHVRAGDRAFLERPGPALIQGEIHRVAERLAHDHHWNPTLAGLTKEGAEAAWTVLLHGHVSGAVGLDHQAIEV